jgi:hypothetical protein
MEDSYYFNCPHCDLMIEVLKTQVNCTIFRCGKYKLNNEQLNPHAQKDLCDQLFKQDLIWGCGKPFKFDGIKVEKCGYI